MALEHSRGVSKSKGHNSVFKVSIVGAERSLLFVARFNPNLVVRVLEV